MPTADRSNAADGGSPSLVEGSFFDVIMRNAAGEQIGTKRFHGFPKHYNIRGSFDRQGRPFSTYSATIEQRIGPVGFEVSYNHQKQTAKRTDNFFASTISFEVNGRPYVETELDEKNFGNEVDQFRGTAVYLFDKWKWMQQLLVASADYLSALPETNDVKILKLASFPSGTSSTDGTEWRQASAVSFSSSGR